MTIGQSQAMQPTTQPIGLDERLKMAFPSGAPDRVSAVFWWLDHNLARGVAAELRERADETADLATVNRVKDLMTRLGRLQSEHTALAFDLERPQLELTAKELADKLSLRTASERLIHDTQAELNRLREGISEQSAQARNCAFLSQFAEVIAGSRQLNDELAIQFGFRSASRLVRAFDLNWRRERIAKEADREKALDSAREKVCARLQEKEQAAVAVEEMSLEEAVRIIYGSNPPSLAIAMALRGPNSLNSDEVCGEQLSGLQQFLYHETSDEKKRAYRRLIEGVQVARYGEEKNHDDWSVITPLALHPDPIDQLGWRDLVKMICEAGSLALPAAVAAFFIEGAEEHKAFNWITIVYGQITSPAAGSSPRLVEAVEQLRALSAGKDARDATAEKTPAGFEELLDDLFEATREKEEIAKRINALSTDEVIDLAYPDSDAPIEVRKAVVGDLTSAFMWTQAVGILGHRIKNANTTEQAIAANRLLEIIQGA